MAKDIDDDLRLCTMRSEIVRPRHNPLPCLAGFVANRC